MNDTPPSTASAETPPRRGSLIARLGNIFAAPGEVFDEIKSAPASVANWLVPILVVVGTTILAFGLMFSQPTIQQQIREMQEKAIDQQVAAGKMKPEQARQAKEFMENLPPWVMQIGGVVQGLVSGFITAFWWALIVWLIGAKILKSDFSFMKALEASGLGLMIFALSMVVSTLLIVVFGTMNARPALSLLVREFDATNKLHLLLGAINVFYLWWMAVLAVAISRFSRASYAKSAAWLFGFWIVSRLLFVGAGMGGMVL